MIKTPENRPGQAFPSSPADQTRGSLIHAGLKLFGRQGFDGTSTREIAALAKANIGSIAYHFGGKEGLHAACADYIVETIRSIAVPALTQATEAESAHSRLARAVERMVAFFVVNPEAADIAQFVVRQLAQPSAALDRLYQGMVEPTHRQLCLLWQEATGEPAESEATKIAVFTMIGQVIYFRIARTAVLRRMDWTGIGQTEAALIADVVKGNLGAILSAWKGGKS